ncbi:MAG: HigA family addiction module antidote protein [Nitrospinae bacterium]|nr:HigA family addiction module antidote protein [Nitrospinota bacterium]
MVETSPNYEPDYAVPPGETLGETLEAIGMSQAELAQRMGRPKKTINGIIMGTTAITPETSIQLERVLGIPCGFWTNLERNYQDAIAKNNERSALGKETGFLNDVPYRELAQRGWIADYRNPVEKLQEIMDFFGVASPKECVEIWNRPEIAFRHSQAFKSDRWALAAWLRKGQLEAQTTNVPDFDGGSFKGVLREIRGLTKEKAWKFEPALKEYCANNGVVLALVQELKNTRVHGATHWFAGKPVIQLTLRYKTDDQFWFSFFHEAGHILLHGRKEIFVEKNIGGSLEKEEKEANLFASNLLIPKAYYEPFKRKGLFTRKGIMEFSSGMGIAPGIVVGRLQHDGLIPYRSNLNYLKKTFEWACNG